MLQRQTVTRTVLTAALTVAVALGVNTARTAARAAGDLMPGRVELKSAGALAFGPNGILFVGDSTAGAVVALDTNDKAAAPGRDIDVQGVDEKLAALVGVPAGRHPHQRRRRQPGVEERLSVGRRAAAVRTRSR